MRYLTTIILNILLAVVSVHAQVSTLYFMKNTYNRHELNPAFQPNANFYIDTPFFPGIRLGAGNNSVTMSDIIYPKEIDGETKMITFLHPEGDKDKFFNQLQPQINFFTEPQVDILTFGFRKGSDYFTFGISQKSSGNVAIPKDIFKLLLYGVPDTLNINRYDFRSLSVSASIYSELALGYSKKIDNKLSVGGKLKFLMGQANISTKFNQFQLDASRDKWSINVDGSLRAAIPLVEYELNDDKLTEFPNFPDEDFVVNELLKPTGIGFAVDLGASYKLMNNLELSASILDLGSIKWNNKSMLLSANNSFDFDGIHYDTADDEDFMNEYGQELLDSLNYTAAYGGYSTGMPAKLMLGAEYFVLKDKISLGLLLKSSPYNRRLHSELTTSANFFPAELFNASISYSLFNGRFSNIGLALGGRLGPFNMYIAGDYLPMRFTPEYIPYKSQAFNLNMGFAMAFGNVNKIKKEKKEK